MFLVVAIIIGALVVAWLGYLVPAFVSRHRDHADEDSATTQFPETMTVVSESGYTISSDTPDTQDSDLEVSTPFTRATAKQELRRAWAKAARRRRNTLLILLGLTTLLAILGATNTISWWFTIAGTVLIAGFLVLSRVSVVRMARRFDARLALINEGWDERTTAMEIPDSFRDAVQEASETPGFSIDLNSPIEDSAGSLWEAVPVTAPTYISQPLSARTVRTIDLSSLGPVPGEVTSPVATRGDEEETREVAVRRTA